MSSLFKMIADKLAQEEKDKAAAKAKAYAEEKVARAVEYSKTGVTTELRDMPETEVVDDIDLGGMDDSTVETTQTSPSRNDIKLNSKQQAAITTALNSPYSNIIGYAGSGKTTTVLELVRQLIEGNKIRKLRDVSSEGAFSDVMGKVEHLNMNSNDYNFAMCAFTGLAVKALKKSVPNEYKRNCYTIHKLIDFAPVEREVLPTAEEVAVRGIDPNIPIVKKFFEPRRHGGRCEKYDQKANSFIPCGKQDPHGTPTEDPKLLPFDFIIVDEISMLGSKLWDQLIEALPPHCRIITIGDIAQLPPVMDVPIQPLLLAQWPTTELTEIYRQKDGDMVSNANAIRQCEKPVINDNFKIMKIDTEESVAQKQVLAYVKAEFKAGRYDPEQDILITPTNVGLTGQEMMNVLTRQFANAGSKITSIRTMRGQKRLAVRDRVLCIKNDNDAGLYNGMLGWVSDITLNAGMGKHAGGGVAPDENMEFDVGAALDSMAEEQKRLASARKVNAMFGGNLVSPETLTGASDDDDEDGTGKRKASHCAHVQFDYEVEDDPSGTAHFHSLGTSTQLENLIPAWWITIHKSQGSGFRNVYILLHNAQAKMLCNELLYTAITRCIENVTIFSTNYAFQKCLTNQRIEGATLEAKIQSYIDSYMSKVSKDEIAAIYIPQPSEYRGKL